jgi:polar amino acid transport system permease protein
MANDPSVADDGPGAGSPGVAERSYRRVDGASFGGTLAVVAGVVFWGWVLLRWTNDWTGGQLVPPGTPFVAPAVVESTLLGVPLLSAGAEIVSLSVSYLPRLSTGLWLTVVLTVVSILLGLPFAIALSVSRVYGNVTSYVSLAYTELFRGTPLLAQLFVLYYGLNLSAFVPGFAEGVFANRAVWVAIVGFTLNSAAYQAEYIRSALQSVEGGQLTAGRAIGLPRLAAIRYIVLPQGLRYAIPGWTNELIYLIKYSSLAAFITVPELFNRANAIASGNFRYLGVFTVTALFYLALVITASRLMNRVEERVAIPGIGHSDGR